MKDSHLTVRLPRELARALGKWARERGVAKSVLVREAVAGYLAPPPATDAGVRVVTAAEAAVRWKRIPRLSPDDSTTFAADIAAAVRAVPPPRTAWE
jgi:predicted transcriptional regulator